MRSQSGATAAEYAILVSLIAVVIITAVVLLGQRTSALYQCTANSYAEHEDRCKPADKNSGG